MSTRNWIPKTILNPRGQWSSQALLREGNPARAALAQNVRFAPGTCYTRDGTSSVQSTTGKVTSMYNWLSPSSNWLVYMDAGAIKTLNLAGGSPATLYTPPTSRAASCSDLATRLYLTAFSNSNAGTMQARVWDGASATADLCFRPPLQFSASSAVDGGAGECTKGLHQIGFIFQSRSGFAGKPSPVNSSNVFLPISITLNAGNRTINVAITLDTPSDAGVGSAIYPIMTTVANPNSWFFVPDNFAILPASASAWTQNFSISISDEDLETSATSADNQFNLLTADVAGTGPFSPNFVAAYGKRMSYGVSNKIYMSGINDAQAISEDLNVVQLQNQRKIACCFPLGQFYYMLGDKFTGKTSDNGDDPATWPQPTTVSDALGTPCPQGVEWRTQGQYAWVAAEPGLYIFDSTYAERPITYFVSDWWNRINWNAPYALQIADDTTALKCYVAVPLDGATEPTHQIVIDYTNGLTYDSCDISIDVYNAATFSSIRMVKEFSTSRTALWIGPSAAGNIVHFDPAVHTDQGAAIDSSWKSGYVREPGEIASTTVRLGNVNSWIKGTGTLLQTWEGLDGSPSVTPPNITLALAPGEYYLSKEDLNPCENFTIKYQTSGVGDYFSLSGFIAWCRPSIWTR